MSKLLQERWKRIAFGSKQLNEGINEDPDLKLLAQEYGFYFAGSDSVVLGDLDDLSGKEYRHNYPLSLIHI